MFEALDFTVSRQPEKQAFSIVQAFMAHHQGMSLVALCNVLCARRAPALVWRRAPGGRA